jgi:hypothetical protein
MCMIQQRPVMSSRPNSLPGSPILFTDFGSWYMVLFSASGHASTPGYKHG